MKAPHEMSSEERLDAVVRRSMRAWRPPPRLKLSEWAEQHFYLSAESAAEPGRFKAIPYQRGIMDAITDPSVTFVTVMKSARVGYTKILNATVGYYMHQDPCPVMVVQPTIEDAEGYSKEEIAPMLRDCPELNALMISDGPKSKDSNNTILHKKFRGGILSMVGANSARGMRRVSRKVVAFDETDGYPMSAGPEGDPIRLGIRRSEYYFDRKILRGSTPTLAGVSRIEAAFLEGDQRRYYVPCLHCGHMDILVFRREADRGHYMQWPEGKPEEAHFVCRRCGSVIEHREKREMVARGEWRPEAPFRGHASFHVWAAYSFSPNATWGQLAEEFVQANKEGAEALKTFVNTVLGETWQEKGDAPDWLRLYQRRESYEIGTVPPAVIFLTAGVDVQKDRLVYEVVGWSEDKQSWGIEAGVLHGDTASEDAPVWRDLDGLLERSWPQGGGAGMPITMMAIDSGYNTNVVYSWTRRHARNRVIATKGVASQRLLVSQPSKVDVTVRGKRLARGHRVWPIGVDLAKSELYGWLQLEPPTRPGEPYPRGYCHHPQYAEGYFKELTAEHLVLVRNRQGFAHYQWQLQPGRENHWLDARILARAAAALAGLDRATPRRPAGPPRPAPPPAEATGAPPAAREPPPVGAAKAPRPAGWLGGSGRSGSWLRRRR